MNTGMKTLISILRPLLAFIMFCGLCHSCFNIRYSTSGASIPIEAKTFSVQSFMNSARISEAGLDQEITDALKDHIQANTRLILVNGFGHCDFEGSIVTYEPGKPVAITSNEKASQNRFTLGVKVRFTCEIKPEMNFESTFTRFEEYDSNNDFNQVKEELTKTLVNQLIEDIFNRAFVNW
jgi:hypothetical protein